MQKFKEVLKNQRLTNSKDCFSRQNKANLPPLPLLVKSHNSSRSGMRAKQMNDGFLPTSSYYSIDEGNNGKSLIQIGMHVDDKTYSKMAVKTKTNNISVYTT